MYTYSVGACQTVSTIGTGRLLDDEFKEATHACKLHVKNERDYFTVGRAMIKDHCKCVELKGSKPCMFPATPTERLSDSIVNERMCETQSAMRSQFTVIV